MNIIDGCRVEKERQFIYLGSVITVDCRCHETSNIQPQEKKLSVNEKNYWEERWRDIRI